MDELIEVPCGQARRYRLGFGVLFQQPATVLADRLEEAVAVPFAARSAAAATVDERPDVGTSSRGWPTSTATVAAYGEAAAEDRQPAERGQPSPLSSR
jgi:hypothetical protein